LNEDKREGRRRRRRRRFINGNGTFYLLFYFPTRG
jgi:hypothetical protein